MRLLSQCLLLVAVLLISSVARADGPGFPLILDMVHHNPGEPRFETKFNDPEVLKQWGYTGQVPKYQLQAATTWDAFDPALLPKGSRERAFCEAEATRIDALLKQASAAGMPVYPFTDVLVVPKSLLDKYGEQMRINKRLSILQPMTQKVMRAQIEDIFTRFPDLQGLTIRFGETYLHDAPYHAGGSPVDTPEEHIALINLMREEVCVKRNKTLIYRTWSFGDRFHTNPTFYLKVTDAIEPHAKLFFSIKHSQGDFTRDVDFNPTLGIGKHAQIVEVSCNQAGLYGKNAWPYYIGKGVIDGWSDWDAGHGNKGLTSLLGNPRIAGIWTWTRGDGWAGPYTPNEFWVDLNAFVIKRFAQDPHRKETEIFSEYAHDHLHLDDAQTAKFRELCLLATKATYHGQESSLIQSSSWWCRDEYLSAVPLAAVVDRGLVEPVLAEKAQAVADFKRVEELSRQIKLPAPADQEFLQVSCAYGRIKIAICQQIYRMQILAAREKKDGRMDLVELADAIKQYDALWTEWRQLKDDHACCPTLYRDDVAEHTGKPFKTALDEYRKRIEQSR